MRRTIRLVPAALATVPLLFAVACRDATHPEDFVATIAPLARPPVRAVVGTTAVDTLAVVVRDAEGKPVRRARIDWSGAGAALPISERTDTAGVARALWRMGPRSGVQTLTASVRGFSVVFQGLAIAGEPEGLVVVSGNGQQGTVGRPLPDPPRVRVTDRLGNRVPGVPVHFAVASGGGSLIGSTAVSDTAGEASAGGWILGDAPGANTVSATLGNGSSATFQASAVAPCTVLTVVEGDGGMQAAGTSRTVRVRVHNQAGGACAGVSVDWVPEGGGQVAPQRSTTDAAGVAAATWTVGAAAGPQALRAYRVDGDTAQTALTLLVTGGSTIDVVRDFGAVPGSSADQEPVLQAALDSAAARGGGVVFIPAGVYGIGNGLIVRSGVHLVGAGPGRTVLRTLVRLLGKLEEGAAVHSAVAMVGASHASVSQLTVDFSVAGTHGNGVSAMPTGASYDGVITTDAEISGVEVIGGGNYHAYMIWNLLGQRIRILNNRIDGRVTGPAASHQEGIENSGGKDVLIRGNEVRNVGLNGIFLLANVREGEEQERVTVVDNQVFDSGRGITLSQLTAYTNGPTRDIRQVRVERNLVRGARHAGILLQQFGGATVSDLLIRNNRVEAPDDGAAAGIRLVGNLSVISGPSDARNVRVEGNVVRGSGAEHAVYVEDVPRVTLARNRVSRGGVAAVKADTILIEENIVEDAPRSGVRLWGTAHDVEIRGNTLTRWGRADTAASGIRIEDTREGRVTGNRFGSNESTPPPAVAVAPSSADIVVFGNRLIGSWGDTPFVNEGEGTNLGTFAVEAGDTVVVVSSALVAPGSAVTVTQTAGPPLPFETTPGNGAFTVRFAVAASGDERFRYAVDP